MKRGVTIFIFYNTDVLSKTRGSHRRCSVRKGVPGNFVKFTRKHLCQSPFFNKVSALRPATLSKKKLWHRCFPVNFVEFLRTPFFTEHLRMTASVVSNIFTKRTSTFYSLRNTNDFTIPFVNDAHNGMRTVSYLGPKI